jgi:hypothetical protein
MPHLWAESEIKMNPGTLLLGAQLLLGGNPNDATADLVIPSPTPIVQQVNAGTTPGVVSSEDDPEAPAGESLKDSTIRDGERVADGLCEARAMIKRSKAAIDEEKKAEKISGVKNMRILHDNGVVIVRAQGCLDNFKKLEPAFKKEYKENTGKEFKFSCTTDGE